jgi:tRNA(Ile)-lysidine synthase
MMNNIHHFQQEKKALTPLTPSFISLQHGTNIDINQLDLHPNQKNELQKKLVQLGFNSRELTKFLSTRKNNESKQLSTGQYLLERKNNQLLFTYHQNTTTPSIEFKKNSLTISGLDKSFYLKAEEKINSAKIKGQISISKWEPGERMIPLGMKGNKKISDVLTELKLTKNQKSSVYVLRDEEKVLWLIGFRLDNRVRLDANQGPDMVLNLKVV